MARNLPISTIQNLCSPEWIAQTYSEYMMDCANAQLELINQATEACVSDALDGAIDELSGYFLDFENTLDDIYKDVIKLIGSPVTYRISADVVNEVMWVLGEVLKGGSEELDIYKQIMIEKLRSLGSESKQFDIDVDRLLDDTDPFSLQELMEKYNTDIYVGTCDRVTTLIHDLKTTVANAVNIDLESAIALDAGFSSLNEILDTLIRDVNGLPSPEMVIKDSLGTIVDRVKTDSNAVFEQMKSSASSCIAWGLGFAATAKQTLSDKLTYYEAQLKAFISDTTETFASSVNTVRMKLAEAGDNVKTFFEMANDELGLTAIVDDTITKAEDTDIFAYTGASPWSSFSTKGAKGVFAAAGKASLAAVTGVFSVATRLLGKLWNKAKPWVKAFTSNPVDIGVCDASDSSYTCSTFSFHQENASVTLTGGDGFTPASASDPFVTLQGKIGNWITIDTFIGIVQFKINKVWGSVDTVSRKIDYDWIIKPKCLNYRGLIKYGIVTKLYPSTTPKFGDQVTVMIGDLTSTYYKTLWMQFLESGDIYPSNDEDEGYIYMGFKVATAILSSIMKMTAEDIFQWDWNDQPLGSWNAVAVETTDINPSTYQNYINQLFPINHNRICIYTRTMIADDDDYWIPAKISNLDFIRVVSGFTTVNDANRFDIVSLSTDIPQEEGSNKYYYSLNVGVAYLIYTYIAQQADKALFPTEYLYLPYYNNSYNMPGGRFRIKTDADNANITSVIMNALIVVIAVISLVIVGKTIIKIFKRKKIAKLSHKIGVMDNAMWNDKPLSTKDAWNYTRYKRKLDKVTNASVGLAGSGSKLNSLASTVKEVQSFMVTDKTNNELQNDDTNSKLDYIVKLITG